jgi:hypothetical protein
MLLSRLKFPVIICAIYVVLASIYTLATPIYEPLDEDYHFAYIQHIAKTGQLPVQNPSIKQPWNQEGSQAPLYYAGMALVVKLVPGADQPYELGHNPHAIIGVRDATTNHNRFTHTAAERFPWQGPILAIYLIRLFGVAIGAWTVYAVYRAALLAVPDNPTVALIAMAFTAFNIMFLAQTGIVNNDILVAALGATASWQIMAIWRDKAQFVWQRWAFLAVTVALATLTKFSGVSLGMIAAALLAIILWKRRITLRQGIIAAALLGGIFLALTGWWFIRNIQLYGDLTGLRILSQIVGLRTEYSIDTFLSELTLMRVSTWGLYGWMNYFVGPDWLPQLMDVLTLLGVIGGIYWLVMTIRARQFARIIPLGLFGLHFLIMSFSIISYTWQIPASVGRLYIPAMVALSLLTAIGWYMAASAIKIPRLAIVLVIIMFIIAALAPFLAIIPAYSTPSVVSALPAEAIPLDIRFDKVNMLGYTISRKPVAPGGTLPVTIYYQGEPDPRNLSLYMTVTGQNGQVIAKLDTYPGSGNLPTSMWESGRNYADHYLIPINANAQGPAQFKIEFGWWNFATGERLRPVRPADSAPLDALVLRGGSLLLPSPVPHFATSQTATFSGALRLKGYTLLPSDAVINPGDKLTLSLVWEALTPVYEDFNIFIHLQTDDGKLVAQDDSPPLQGDYPTSAWATGAPFNDPHTIQIGADVAPGTYRLMIGLYRLRDGSRLPVDSGGDSLTLQTPITIR